MSLPLEQLKDQTLKRLDLPNKTVESPQGLNTLYLQKILNLVYQVNDIWTTPHQLDISAAADISAAGRSFTAPIDARRIIFSMRIAYNATATVGNRTVNVDKLSKGNLIINRFVTATVAASGVPTWVVSMSQENAESVNRELFQPLFLEPEWKIRVIDTANRDPADDLSWQIEYLEVPI